MPIELNTNGATTTLNGSINNSVTSLVVTSASLFPTSGNFRIIIDSEIMLVTAVSGTTFTVTRALEGTTAASHSNGVNVTHILTASSLVQFIRDYHHLGDQKPVTPGTYDEEFEGTADTLPTNWSWDTTPSGSDSFKVNSKWPSLLTLEGTANASYVLTRASFSPASTFGLWCKVYNGVIRAADDDNIRFYIQDSSGNNGKAIELRSSNQNAPQVRGLKKVSGSESTDFSLLGVALGVQCTSLYLGLTRDGSNNWRGWFSSDGIAWQLYGALSNASITVDHFLFQMGTSSANGLMGIDWVRYRADNAFPSP